MKQEFLEIDPKKKEEQIYYPSVDFVSNPQIGSPQEDKTFVDLTFKMEKEGCCSERIIRTDMNSFIHRNPFQKICVYFFIITGISIGLIVAINDHFNLSSIIGGLVYILIFILIAFIGDCNGYFSENLILESNSIMIIKKSLFRKRRIIYNRGELDMFGLYYKYVKKSKKNKQKYTLYFIKKIGEKDKFLEITKDKNDNDFQGVKYFIDLINTHIKKNMQ